MLSGTPWITTAARCHAGRASTLPVFEKNAEPVVGAEATAANNYHNPFLESLAWRRESHMRKSSGILLGSTAALAILSAPVLAKSSGAQKNDDKSGAAACSAYEKAPDGSWTPVPCQEIGPGSRKHQESKPPSDDDTKH
jgi:hypothetical protein